MNVYIFCTAVLAAKSWWRARTQCSQRNVWNVRPTAGLCKATGVNDNTTGNFANVSRIFIHKIFPAIIILEICELTTGADCMKMYRTYFITGDKSIIFAATISLTYVRGHLAMAAITCIPRFCRKTFVLLIPSGYYMVNSMLTSHVQSKCWHIMGNSTFGNISYCHKMLNGCFRG